MKTSTPASASSTKARNSRSTMSSPWAGAPARPTSSRPRARTKTLDGAITFYGPIDTADHARRKFAARALRASIPTNDPVTTHDAVLAFQQRMKDAGNDCEGWFIAAGSGWSNPKSKDLQSDRGQGSVESRLPFLIRIGARAGEAEEGLDHRQGEGQDREHFSSSDRLGPDDFDRST